MIAPTAQTTITAFRGCPLWTLETQPEKGSTPSRATAKTSRDAATIAIAVFYRVRHAWYLGEYLRATMQRCI